MKIKSYQELVAWQKAMDLVGIVYQASRGFPREEMFALTSQVRRAATSVPSNIAEGQARNSTKEFLHHLSIAQGSLAEVETQMLIAERLDYVKKPVLEPLMSLSSEVGRLMHGLSNALSKRMEGR